mmetsp:Transcript_41606/g.106472  ORF Transcript_41606/g.106472 Transcript_41606/m.106472 type:complete len:208 (+) Transcript_41606:1217-1840(+)
MRSRPRVGRRALAAGCACRRGGRALRLDIESGGYTFRLDAAGPVPWRCILRPDIRSSSSGPRGGQVLHLGDCGGLFAQCRILHSDIGGSGGGGVSRGSHILPLDISSSSRRGGSGGQSFHLGGGGRILCRRVHHLDTSSSSRSSSGGGSALHLGSSGSGCRCGRLPPLRRRRLRRLVGGDEPGLQLRDTWEPGLCDLLLCLPARLAL